MEARNMSMDVNNVNSLVGYTSSDSIYSLDIAQQKSKLKTLFSQSYYNNGEVSRGTLNPEIERLNKKIADLEKVLEELIEKAEKNRVVVEAKSQELSDLIMKIDDANEQFLHGQKNAVDASVSSALKDYETGVIGKAEIATRIQYYIAQNSPDVEANKIQRLFTQYYMQQSDFKSSVSDATSIIDSHNLIKTQMGTTKATLALLTQTRDNMGTAAGAYKNVDTQATVPIYTPKKESLIDSYIDKYSSRWAGEGGDTVKEGVTVGSAEQKAALISNIKEQYGVEQTKGVDAYSMNNAQLRSFADALAGDDNIISQMGNMGFSQKEIIEAVSQIFPSLGIKYQTDGSYVVPHGHNTGEYSILDPRGPAVSTYTKFINELQNSTNIVVDPAKTVEVNPQLAEMNIAITQDGILKEMKNNGFTLKEAMYAMQKLFPGANIGFELGKTDLTLPEGDDAGAKALYAELGKQVKDLWGANVTYDKSNTGNGNNDGGDELPPPKRTDPVGFSIGNTTYEFMIDRNNDGVMNDISEMVGANGIDGIEELLSLADENGIIKGDALDKLMLLRTNHDNRDYGFISAKEAGIMEINLKDVLNTNDHGNDFINVNDALKTNTFNITLNNGQKVEGYQKYETDAYIGTVYKEAFGRNMFSQLSDAKVNSEINKAFTYVEDKLEDVQDIIDAIDNAFNGDDQITKRYATFSANKQEVEGYRNQKIAEATVDSRNSFGVSNNSEVKKDELEEE